MQKLEDAELRPSPSRDDIMAMPLPLPKYTIRDLYSFQPDGQRYELLEGFLIVTPGPGAPHQLVAARLMGALMNYLGSAAYVVGPGTVEQPPLTHLEPDLLVFPPPLPKRLEWKKLSGHWLAVEIYSRSSRRYDHDYKRDAYLALGVREVWLIDRRERSVLVSTEAKRDRRITEVLTWHPPELGDAFSLPLDQLFVDL